MATNSPVLFWAGSPLAGGIVDLIALATTNCNGVKGLEGAQTDAGDGHYGGPECDQDGLGVVEGHGQVVSHGNHQGVVATAEVPITCRLGEEKKPACTESSILPSGASLSALFPSHPNCGCPLWCPQAGR